MFAELTAVHLLLASLACARRFLFRTTQANGRLIMESSRICLLLTALRARVARLTTQCAPVPFRICYSVLAEL